MPAFKDLTGQTIGNHVVIEYAGKYKHGGAQWKCKCLLCGKEYVARGDKAAKPTACSVTCAVTASNKARTEHGLNVRGNEHPLSRIWAGIKQRCYNPKSTSYRLYGGRGIAMYEPWVSDVAAFVTYAATLPGYGEPMASLDRIDNDGNYEPGNLRWASQREQSNNRNRTLSAEYEGEVLPLSVIAERAGVSYMNVFRRYKQGLRGVQLVTNQPIGRKPTRRSS